MFDPRKIDTKLLVEAVPYLSMIEMQDYDWDDLGELLNLHLRRRAESRTQHSA